MICRTQPRRMKGRSVFSYCESKKKRDVSKLGNPDLHSPVSVPIFSGGSCGIFRFFPTRPWVGLCPSALVRIVWKSVGYMHIKVYIKIKVLFMAVSRIGVVVNVRTTNDQSVHRWRCSPSFVHKENTNRVLSVFISFSSAFFFMASSSDIRTT